MCKGEPEGACRVVMSLYSLLGALIHLLFAILLSVFLSSTLLDCIISLPFTEIHQQLAILLGSYAIIESFVIFLLSTAMFLIDPFSFSDQSSFAISVAVISNYITLASTALSRETSVDSWVYFIDVLLKLFAVVNWIFTITLLMLAVRVVNRKYVTHTTATLG